MAQAQSNISLSVTDQVAIVIRLDPLNGFKTVTLSEKTIRDWTISFQLFITVTDERIVNFAITLAKGTHRLQSFLLCFLFSFTPD